AGLPMGVLAQRLELRTSPNKLDREFKAAFPSSAAAPPVVSALGRLLGPGVHATLLRGPWLEQSLAEQQPAKTIYVIQPDPKGTLMMKREQGGSFEALDRAPESIDVDREILVLRLYSGYTLEQDFMRPLLTEDDYHVRLRALWGTRALHPGL